MSNQPSHDQLMELRPHFRRPPTDACWQHCIPPELWVAAPLYAQQGGYYRIWTLHPWEEVTWDDFNVKVHLGDDVMGKRADESQREDAARVLIQMCGGPARDAVSSNEEH